MSKIRMNFASESEAKLNSQINTELHASYVYQSMSTYFQRDDVALKGFEKYFHKLSEEEREHAEKIMKYINKRGGSVKLANIEKPEKDNWGSCEEALESALQLEKVVYQNLLDIHQVASEKCDPHLCDWLEEELLKEQVDSLYELSHHITNIKRVGKGLGEYMFDKETLDSSS